MVMFVLNVAVVVCYSRMPDWPSGCTPLSQHARHSMKSQYLSSV